MKIFYVFAILMFMVFPFFSMRAANMPATATKCTGGVCLDNPLGENVTPEIFIGKIILAVLGIVGSLALVMFIYGGLTWMTASGNSEKVEKGKNIIIWAVIGLAVIFMSYAMVRFVFTSLGGAT